MFGLHPARTQSTPLRRANSNCQPYPSVSIFCSHIPSFPLKLGSRFCTKTIPLPKLSLISNAQAYLFLYLCTPLPLASAHVFLLLNDQSLRTQANTTHSPSNFSRSCGSPHKKEKSYELSLTPTLQSSQTPPEGAEIRG